MRHLLLTVSLALGLAATTAPAQEVASELVSLESGVDARGWESVGRLDIRNKGFCTATLIEDDLILTAAHCVYDGSGGLIDADRLTFHAGLRAGRAEATRGVTRLIAHPAYRHEGGVTEPNRVAMDIAVLRLDRPIRRPRIQPFPIAARPDFGDEVFVVSYGRSRSEAASLQDLCSVKGRQEGIIVMTCAVEPGSSGSPVFITQDGERRIASVVSAMANLDGEPVSLGTSLQEPLQELLAHFARSGTVAPAGEVRIMSIGERNGTGAKFIRR
ncbi:V8-like Glu-specific endopeptidase [Cognatiyoonia koreensis]|uniref:V8-like Glu-specific endopeptidase n=1 Tax=Cognatiyoonia koreensis TaxID=364200 RepID=A0A1I0QUG3_9RHOB|nr:trypsin-like serine protease [Cognatiyoonia koreensis]SEW31026.1 V8-like Glu-specific endopeptidase [Cognatiyoonia koreensis]